MKKMGFVKSEKENERRIALLPDDMDDLKDFADYLVFETGYGKEFGIDDKEYQANGAHTSDREEILRICDIVCDPKVGDAEYLRELKEGRTLFGWVHPHVCEEVKIILLRKKFEVYAWEEMMEEGMQVFYKNNVLAGEAAVRHACQCYGMLPAGKRAAVIGKGNAALGAVKALTQDGAEVIVYGRNQEEKLRMDIGEFDILVNAVLWDPKRKDHIIDKETLCHAKKEALLIDVSCDKAGAVETSHPTTYECPLYVEEGVVHYCVDHTPSIYYRTASSYISEQVKRFVRPLVTGEADRILESGCVIRGGHMLLKESWR